METKKRPATLVLEDGTVFTGYAFGAQKAVSGGVVFNTGMVGYPESLTDPSYRGQILTMTYPLMGNYGVPGYEQEDGLLKYFESDRIQVQGLVVSEWSQEYAHWNGEKSLSEWLQEQNIPGIYGIDTRALTKRLREQGVMLGSRLFTKKGLNGWLLWIVVSRIISSELFSGAISLLFAVPGIIIL
jgi:carbamoyl-phosphate synthase small subunit